MSEMCCTLLAENVGRKNWPKIRGRGQGKVIDESLEFGVRDANANCLPDFVTFQNFKQQNTPLQAK